MEVKAREMHSKLLLACFAAEKGYTVITGDRRMVESSLSYLPKGIYFAKAANKGDINLFNYVLKFEHIIVAQDEEALGIYRTDSGIIINRVLSEDAFQLLKKYFAWGNVDAEIIKSRVSSSRNKITITGSPRVDLLRPEFLSTLDNGVKSINERVGRFVLVNTNFSGINNFFEPYRDIICQSSDNGNVSKSDENIDDEKLGFERDIFIYFINMIRELSNAFPHHILVIRPHPGENHQFWIDKMKDLSNVKVIYEGNVLAWIAAADILIHNRCTTGIESYVMNKTPTIAYCPINLTSFDMYLPNDLSYKVKNLPDLIEMVDKFLGKKEGEAFVDDNGMVKRKIANEHIASLEGKFACERIVEVLDTINISSGMRRRKLINSIFCYKSKFTNYIMRIVMRRRKSYKYTNQKFPGLELAEVDACITKFQDATGRFGSVKYIQLDKNLFKIYCDSK